jgi:hypothetical protein
MIQIKNTFRKVWQWVAGESIMIWHWFKNLAFVFLTTRNQMRVFEGYGHYWFAIKYANRRYNMTKANKYCGGKRHYVLPAGDYSLAVVNRLEIEALKKKGFYKGLDILKILKYAYYVTSNTPNK